VHNKMYLVFTSRKIMAWRIYEVWFCR
jgi:hypothetical protein